MTPFDRALLGVILAEVIFTQALVYKYSAGKEDLGGALMFTWLLLFVGALGYLGWSILHA